MNIHELLARARQRSGIKSTRGLAREISISLAGLQRIENRRGLPSDDTMVRISLLAGITPEHGLVLLNIWRSHGNVASIYRRIYQQLTENAVNERQIKPKSNPRTAEEQIHAG